MTTSISAERFDMLQRSYSVILEPDDGAYTVIVPALPEAHTWGETPEQALAMAREVIQLCVDERRSRGQELPPSDAGATQLATITIDAA